MAGIKRTDLDVLFSRYVRARSDWSCDCCGRKDKKLECAHVFGRRHVWTRCDPGNAVCLCFECHGWFTSNPTDFADWVRGYLGSDHVEAIRQRTLWTDTITRADRLECADQLYSALNDWGDDQAEELYRKACSWINGKKKKQKVTRGVHGAASSTNRAQSRSKYKRKVSGEVVER